MRHESFLFRIISPRLAAPDGVFAVCNFDLTHGILKPVSHGGEERPCYSLPDPRGLAPQEHMCSVLEAPRRVRKITFNADFSKSCTSYFFKKEIKITPPTRQVGSLTQWAASSSFSPWSSFTASSCLAGRCHPLPASKPLTAALCVALTPSSLMSPNAKMPNLQVKLNFQNKDFIPCCC